MSLTASVSSFDPPRVFRFREFRFREFPVVSDSLKEFNPYSVRILNIGPSASVSFHF
jgi:hypothetical protein